MLSIILSEKLKMIIDVNNSETLIFPSTMVMNNFSLFNIKYKILYSSIIHDLQRKKTLSICQKKDKYTLNLVVNNLWILVTNTLYGVHHVPCYWYLPDDI